MRLSSGAILSRVFYHAQSFGSTAVCPHHGNPSACLRPTRDVTAIPRVREVKAACQPSKA